MSVMWVLKEVVQRALAERFGILPLASVKTEVELGNDECS
jgi:hypothetical protein